MKTPQSNTPVKSRKNSVDLTSPKQAEQMLDLGYYSSFQSPIKKHPKGKPPLNRYTNNISDIDELSSIELKTESPVKVSTRSTKYRQLSAQYVLNKAKFVQKVLYESNKLGLASN